MPALWAGASGPTGSGAAEVEGAEAGPEAVRALTAPARGYQRLWNRDRHRTGHPQPPLRWHGYRSRGRHGCQFQREHLWCGRDRIVLGHRRWRRRTPQRLQRHDQARRPRSVLGWNSSQQPVAFVANAGQWSDGSDFHGRTRARLPGRCTLRFGCHRGVVASPDRPGAATGLTVGVRRYRAELNWTGAPTRASRPPVQAATWASVSNFLDGSDPSQWHTGARRVLRGPVRQPVERRQS